jgi:hypothetical protein
MASDLLPYASATAVNFGRRYPSRRCRSHFGRSEITAITFDAAAVNALAARDKDDRRWPGLNALSPCVNAVIALICQLSGLHSA